MRNFKTNSTIVRRFKISDVNQFQQIFKQESNYNDLLKSFEHLDTNKGFRMCKMVIKSCIKEFNSKEPIWAVINRKNGRLIGYIRIDKYSIKNKRCNITFKMSERYWNSECMKEAFDVILKYCFTKLNMRLVESAYYCQNDKMDNILVDVGMTQEAILRNRRYEPETDTYSDFIIFSITKLEYYEKNKFTKQENRIIKFRRKYDEFENDTNEQFSKKIIKIKNKNINKTKNKTYSSSCA